MDVARILSLGAIALAAGGALVPVAVSSRVSEKAIASTIEHNPEYVATALQVLQNRQQEQQRAEASNTALPVVRTILKGDRMIPAIGRAGAPDVVEFFDYNCGYCKIFGQQTADPLLAAGRIRLHLVQAPILGEGSRRLAEYAAAAQLQGRFAQAHAFLLRQRAPTTQAAQALAPAFVAAAGLDKTSFNKAMTDGSAKALVDHSYGLAMKAQLRGTPLIYAGGHVFSGAVDKATLEARIR